MSETPESKDKRKPLTNYRQADSAKPEGKPYMLNAAPYLYCYR